MAGSVTACPFQAASVAAPERSSQPRPGKARAPPTYRLCAAATPPTANCQKGMLRGGWCFAASAVASVEAGFGGPTAVHG